MAYGGSEPDDAAILAMLNRLGLDDLLARLPQGLDSRISEQGGGLSTGEKARLALARALLAEPRVLLLDEAEANLDAQARACLAEVIAAFKGTVLFISHDSDRARAADRMLRVADGQVTPVKPQDNNDNDSDWTLRQVG